MSNLLEQWNEHVIRGNQLSRELENFDGIMHVVDIPDSKVALYAAGGTTHIDLVLPNEVMTVLKTIVTNQLVDIRTRKEIDLKKHMNSWKPATVNPEFEAAVKEKEESDKPRLRQEAKKLTEGLAPLSECNIKKGPDPVEEKLEIILQKQEKEIKDKIHMKPNLNVEDVKRMYQDEGKSMKDIADYFGVSKAVVNNYIYNNKLGRRKFKDDGYLDAQVEARTRREHP